MKGLITGAAIALALCSACAQSNLKDVYEKHHERMLNDNKGVAVMISKDGKTDAMGIGKFDFNEHSVFNVGSATKTFTAILILQEEEKGNLKLSDSIGTFLSPINNVDGSLTVEALLTHESGLDEVIGRNIRDIFYAKHDSVYNSPLLLQVEENSPEEIGKFNYCNTNYFLLGKILESVTDQSYFDLVRERILEPLEMNETYPYVHKNLPNLAVPYHNGENVIEYLDYRFFADVAYSAGSIASTLSDMEIFFTELFEGTKLLQPKSLAKMLNEGNEAYGLGIFKPETEEDSFYGHGGNNIGYAFRNGYDIENKTLYLLFSNSITIPFGGILQEDLSTVLRGEEVKQAEAVNIEKFSHFVGTYELKEAEMTFEILIEDGKIYVYVPAQGVKSELIQENETTLKDMQVGATFTSIEGSNDELTFSQSGYITKIYRVKE